jgi:hypothetical protein
MRRGSIVIGTAMAFGMAAFPGAGTLSVSAQEECHYAYGGCLPYVDDLNCEDMAGRVTGLGRVPTCSDQLKGAIHTVHACPIHMAI